MHVGRKQLNYFTCAQDENRPKEETKGVLHFLNLKLMQWEETYEQSNLSVE